MTKKSFAEAAVASAGNVILNLPSFQRLIEYWYAMKLACLSEDKVVAWCFIEHIIDLYHANLREVPAKAIKKIPYRLHTLQEPFDIVGCR